MSPPNGETPTEHPRSPHAADFVGGGAAGNVRSGTGMGRYATTDCGVRSTTSNGRASGLSDDAFSMRGPLPWMAWQPPSAAAAANPSTKRATSPIVSYAFFSHPPAAVCCQ